MKEVKCIYCRKDMLVREANSSKGKIHNANVKRRISVCCSKECSRQYARIYLIIIRKYMKRKNEKEQKKNYCPQCNFEAEVEEGKEICKWCRIKNE